MISGRFCRDFPAWSCQQMYDLAADIESYPVFLPWCRSTTIRRRQGDVLDVENHFGAGPFDWAFRSRAEQNPPHRLEISSTDGPFRRFHLAWHFFPLPQAPGCRVEAEYSLVLRSSLAQGLARLMAAEAEQKALRCFEARAKSLYGEAKFG